MKKSHQQSKNNIPLYHVTLIERDGKATSVNDSKMVIYENGDIFV